MENKNEIIINDNQPIIKASEKTTNLMDKFHNAIISSNKNIFFRVLPIYVKYFLDDKVIASIYYRNNKVMLCSLRV